VGEDQPELRGLLSLALSAAGFRVYTAADGDEAVRLFRDHRDEITAALLDRGMPGKDGPETLAELRTLRPDLPCCLMTGAGPDAEEEMLARGANRVLSKPFELAELVAVMLVLCPRPAGSPPVNSPG
jgi:DNA-binding response OmpR family regulator